MINVIASIHIKEGNLHEYLQILRAGLATVRKEKGCVEYIPTADVETGLPVQALDKNVVTILERWESLETLRAHLASPHMLAYREKVKDVVDRVSVKVVGELDLSSG